MRLIRRRNIALRILPTAPGAPSNHWGGDPPEVFSDDWFSRAMLPRRNLRREDSGARGRLGYMGAGMMPILRIGRFPACAESGVRRRRGSSRAPCNQGLRCACSSCKCRLRREDTADIRPPKMESDIGGGRHRRKCRAPPTPPTDSLDGRE